MPAESAAPPGRIPGVAVRLGRRWTQQEGASLDSSETGHGRIIDIDFFRFLTDRRRWRVTSHRAPQEEIPNDRAFISLVPYTAPVSR